MASRGLLLAPPAVAGLLALVVSTAGCGSSQAADPSTGSPTPVMGLAMVEIRNFSFQPAKLTVSTGTTVVWRNDDPSTHTATGDGGSFDVGRIDPGATRSHTFQQAGTFAYHCAIHQYMTATVVVMAQP